MTGWLWSAGRRVLIGGISSWHDPLVAAALRGAGIDAEAVPPANDDALAVGRALLPRGHPCSTYYLAGALAQHLRLAPAAGNRAGIAYVIPASRFPPYASDFRLALAAAGLGEVRVLAVSIPTLLVAGGATARAAVRGALLGDVLARAGAAALAARDAPEAVETAARRAVARVAQALACRAGVREALEELRSTLCRVPRVEELRGPGATPVRVRLTGEPLSALATGFGGGLVASALVARGAAVELPTVAEWLLYLSWKRREGRGSPPGLERAVRRLFGRYAHAVGLPFAARLLPDPDEGAALAAPHYPVPLPGGSAHLEIAAYLTAAREQSADLVVSVKPFASITSSAISDAVMHSLARRGGPAFLSIELTGDAAVQVESRLDLAVAMTARRRGTPRERR